MASRDRRHGLPRHAGHARELLLRVTPGLAREPELGPADHRLASVPRPEVARGPAAVSADCPGRPGTAGPSGPKRGGAVAMNFRSCPAGAAPGSPPGPGPPP